MFNKEKRQEKKERRAAVKATLEKEIQPRPTFQQKQDRLAKRKEAEAASDKRHAIVNARIQAMHAGEGNQGVAQMGSELLYVGHISGLQWKVQDQWSTPEKVVTRWTVYGRHDRDFLGMAPTNRDVTFGGVTISHVAQEDLDVGEVGEVGEHVTQEFHYWDMVALLQQIQAP